MIKIFHLLHLTTMQFSGVRIYPTHDFRNKIEPKNELLTQTIGMPLIISCRGMPGILEGDIMKEKG